ncbi:hypothetical protein INR49_031150 [Caranx melampygus]|nr:hypothetical protein INR49_031150 [Caranx melampygus]
MSDAVQLPVKPEIPTNTNPSHSFPNPPPPPPPPSLCPTPPELALLGSKLSSNTEQQENNPDSPEFQKSPSYILHDGFFRTDT